MNLFIVATNLVQALWLSRGFYTKLSPTQIKPQPGVGIAFPKEMIKISVSLTSRLLRSGVHSSMPVDPND